MSQTNIRQYPPHSVGRLCNLTPDGGVLVGRPVTPAEVVLGTLQDALAGVQLDERDLAAIRWFAGWVDLPTAEVFAGLFNRARLIPPRRRE